MKQFFRFIAKILMIFLLLSFALDLVYTKIYEFSNPRTKFQLLKSLEKKKVDYVFLGSSRVENGIDINLIEEKTGKTAVNLGFQASKLSDVYILLKLMKEYKIDAKKVLVQVDYSYNIENGFSNILQYEMMPFIRDNAATKEYFDLHYNEDKMLYYFPFYRYCDFDAKIGFRELMMNVVNKKTDILENKGFNGLDGILIGENIELPTTIKKSNIYLEKIKEFAKTNKINLVFYCAPFHPKTKNLGYIAKLKGKIKNLHNFSEVVKEDKMFKDYSHLNKDGANFFTDYLITHLLSNKRL